MPTLNFPSKKVDAKYSTGGVLGTMAVQFSVNGGAYSAPIVSSSGASWDCSVPGLETAIITFAAGTYVLNDVDTFNNDGTTAHSGSGAPRPTCRSKGFGAGGSMDYPWP